MKIEPETLMDGLFKEMERNRELLEAYLSIGPAGAFGATIIKNNIKSAEEAIKENDVVKMLRAYSQLKEAK